MLGFLTLRAPEVGDLVELLLLKQERVETRDSQRPIVNSTLTPLQTAAHVFREQKPPVYTRTDGMTHLVRRTVMVDRT